MCHGSTGSPSALLGVAHRGCYEERGGLVDTRVGSEAGGYGRCQWVVPYGSERGGVTVLEGGRVLARGTGSCT